MHTKEILPRCCFALTAGLLLCLPEAAVAFKPYTHGFTADQARQDAIDNGRVTINGREYALRPEVVTALRDWPAFYNCGVIGPDGIPDLLYGQSVIHPVWTGEWLQLLFNSAWAAQSDPTYTAAERSQILAFTYGFLTHAAGDMWGHTLINGFSGGVFPEFLDIPTNLKAAANAFKHILVEGYVGDATPGWDGNREQRKSAPNGDISDDSTPGHEFECPHKFIYRTLIDPDALTPWDIHDSTPKRAVRGSYIKARGLLIGFFLERRDDLRDFAAYSTNPLADALNAYSDTVAALANVDCDFDEFWDIWDCPETLAIYFGNVVIDSAEAFVTFAADELENLGLAVLDAYVNAWIADINDGLEHWSEFGLALTKGLFDPQTRRDVQNAPAPVGCATANPDELDPLRAQCESEIGMRRVVYEQAEGFLQQHMLSMIGLPDAVGEVWEAITPVLDEFKNLLVVLELPLNPLQELKADLKQYLTEMIEDDIRNATGVDIEALEGFLKHPSQWVCLDGAPFTFPPPIGAVSIALFKPGERARLDKLMGFNLGDHEDEPALPPGCGRLKDSAEFDPDVFAAVRNTITMAKLLLLDGPELNHVLSDILCRSITTYQPGQNVMIESLPLLPGKDSLPWLRLIDGDHAWRRDGLPRFVDEGTLPPASLSYPWNYPTSRKPDLDGGSGRFPIWASCELRPAFRVLFKDWENGVDNFPDLGDGPSGTCPCFEVNGVTLYCLPDASGMDLVVKNNSTNAINSVTLSGFPTGVVANPSLFQLQNALTAGQEVLLSTVMSNVNVIGPGSMTFNIGVGSLGGPLPCSKAQCVSLPDCCFLITHERMDLAGALNNSYAYSFTFTSQANTPITRIVLKPIQAGFTVNPTEILLDPPLFPGSSRVISGISVQVANGVSSSSLCCKVAAYDANSFKNCNRQHCIPYMPLIAFSDPTDGSRFFDPANIQILAAVATNVTPTQVTFYWDDAVVFTTNTPPFSFTLSGVTSGVHSLLGVGSDSSGATFCSDPISIIVTQAPSIFITGQPQDQTVVAGSSVTFSVGATGQAPLSYQWCNDGADLAWATNAALTLTNLQVADSGTYCVRVGNGGGVVVSTNAYLTVNDPPSFTFQPRDQTNFPGGTVTFIVAVAGTMPLGYAWQFNNSVIATATNRSITLTNLQPVQAGNYRVVVSNVAGTATSGDAILTLLADVPRIISGPASRVVTNGSSVTFTVSAAGAQPLSYQWRFNGTNLAGATRSAFALSQVYETNGGFYGVIVSNVFGTNSAAALLTVLPPYFNFELLDFANQWSYDQSGTDLGTAWREVGFDDSSWPSGQSLLGSDATPANWPEPIRTPLEVATNLITYYFRTHFDFPLGLEGVRLISSNYVDDGAVYYLNGQEIARLRMPPNDVTYQTLATTPATDGMLSTFNLPATNLVQGDNVLAVELHQSRTNGPDIMFGMTLLALVPGLAAPVSNATVTNGLVAYWPLDKIEGNVTPEYVNGYHMTLQNLSAGDLVAGYTNYGGIYATSKCFQFVNSRSTLLRYAAGPSDLVPINQHSNFTVAMWVKASGAANNDLRVFGEQSFNLGNNNPLWVVGTGGGGTSLDTAAHWLLRHQAQACMPPSGTNQTPDVNLTQAGAATSAAHPVFDDNWHHLAIAMNTNGAYSVYVDGVEDPGNGSNSSASRGGAPAVLADLPLTNQFGGRWRWQVNSVSIGGIARTIPGSSFINGAVDDVAMWNRALSSNEVSFVYSHGLHVIRNTNTISIKKFAVDFAEVAAGDKAIVRWETDGATNLTITGIGNVTAQTTNGLGATNLPVAAPTTYNLTIRGSLGDTRTASAQVSSILPGVAAGWHLLDRFDTYADSAAGIAGGNWTSVNTDASGVRDRFNVVTESGTNKVLAPRTGYGNPAAGNPRGALAGLALNGLSINEGSSSTLFFRFYLADTNCTPFNYNVGLTDKGLRLVSDFADFDIGPHIAIRRADGASPVDVIGHSFINNGSNGSSYASLIDPNGLKKATVYNVWVDVSNSPVTVSIVDDGGGGFITNQSPGDVFSVWIATNGAATRTLLFSNYYSDRDYVGYNPVAGAPRPNLDLLFVQVDDQRDPYLGTNTVVVDDFYLSASGFLATVPRVIEPFPSGPQTTIRLLKPAYLASDPNNFNLPSLTLTWDSALSCGPFTVMRSDSVTGANWTTVATAIPSGGATTSYTDKTITSSQAFYRISSP